MCELSDFYLEYLKQNSNPNPKKTPTVLKREDHDLLLKFLKKQGKRLSGALAANAYRTIPRATMDVDIAVPFSKEILQQIKDVFSDYVVEDWDLIKRRFKVKKENPNVLVPEVFCLKHPSGFEINFFPLYSKFLTRKHVVKFRDLEMDIIGPEDLIIINKKHFS
ncbi:MAG: hypothetical protein ACTSRB_18055 [Candidatus Helarchaeota archaeon]